MQSTDDEQQPLRSLKGTKEQSDSNIKYLVDNKDIEISSKHEALVQESRTLFVKVLYVFLSFSLTYSMRTNIFVLYARTFYDNTAIISVVVYLSYLMSAVSSLVFGIIGDRWRYDYLLVIAAIADVITFWMEAATTSFIVLAVAYAVGGQPFQAIGQSWNIKLLPTNYALEFKAQFLTLFTLGYIIGPLIGGILAWAFSYRLVFYVSAIFAVILLIFTLVFFWNVETNLLEKQSQMDQFYVNHREPPTKVSDSNYQATEMMIERKEIDSEQSETTERDVSQTQDKYPNMTIMDVASMGDEFKWLILEDYRFPVCLDHKMVDSLMDIGKYRAFLLLLTMLDGAFLISVETSTVVYYTTYMEDRFDSSILVSSCQLATFALTFVIGTQFVKKFVNLMQQRKMEQQAAQLRFDFHSLYVNVPLACLFVMLLFSAWILPNNSFDLDNNDSFVAEFWIATSIYGLAFGMAYLSLQMIAVELTPKNVAGKIVGITTVLRMVGKGTVCLVVGLLWDYSIESLWYTQAVCQAITILLVVTMATLETLQWYNV